jgi:hypothetical protein
MYFPANLDIQPSRRLRAALVFFHLAAFLSLILILPEWWATAAALAMLASAMQCWRNLSGVVRLSLGADGRVEWNFEDGRRTPGEVLGDSTCFPGLAVLRIVLAGEKRCRNLILLGDSFSDHEFRRLRIWLRWVAPFRSGQGDGQE